MSSDPSSSALPGVLHHYSARLTAFEYGSRDTTHQKRHTLLFIGGLSDGFGTVPFVNDIAASLEDTEWSVFFILLSSSYSGWGVSSLGKDVEEIAECVEYIRQYKAGQAAQSAEAGKVVLMGHSTGSQDVLHYLYAPNPLPHDPSFDAGLEHVARPPIDGAILQSPVSDREALLHTLKTGVPGISPEELTKLYNEAIEFAKKPTYTEDKQDVTMPISMTAKLGFPGDTVLTCRRFLSLTSPDSPRHPEEDDVFSSDLDDQRLQQTFGMIASRGLLKQTLLALPGGSDQYVPPWVNKSELLKRWENATNAGAGGKKIWDDERSGPIPGATHSPSGDEQTEPRRELVSRVKGYLRQLEGSS
ncbi:hypothetical protein FQN54_003998 [Arachnomyces sp. PD_36]|nr:hypothetical protein FQN54_003998 [Arachnomyces sp. PD_36]